VISTEEKGTTSIYYLWYSERDFFWSAGRWRDWPIVNGPAKAVMAKGTDQLLEFQLVGRAANKNALPQIFPAAVQDSAIFKPGKAEHNAMIEKLAANLETAVQAYFGSEPLVDSVGVVSSINGNILNVKLSQDGGDRPGSASGQSARFFVSSNTAPLILRPVKESGTSTANIVIGPQDLNSIFGTKATSTWKKRLFRFETRSGELLGLSPLL
jgi:hypothetical protein